MTWGWERGKFWPCQGKRDGTKVGMHGGVGDAVSGDDNGIGEPDDETGGNDEVGWMGKEISIYPIPPHFFMVEDLLRKDKSFRNIKV